MRTTRIQGFKRYQDYPYTGLERYEEYEYIELGVISRDINTPN